MKENGYEYTWGNVTVKLAEAYGFCWGVERAVQIAYEARQQFPTEKIWLTNEIIHNPTVNKVLILTNTLRSDLVIHVMKRMFCSVCQWFHFSFLSILLITFLIFISCFFFRSFPEKSIPVYKFAIALIWFCVYKSIPEKSTTLRSGFSFVYPRSLTI